VLSIPGSNTDFAPTWLALAGLSNSHMDGSSFLSHLMPSSKTKSEAVAISSPAHQSAAAVHSGSNGGDGRVAGTSDSEKPWRDFHYSEYNSLGNLWRGGGEIIKGDHLIDDPVSHTYRAVRFVDSHAHGNALYAEYTSLIDWNYENYSCYASMMSLPRELGVGAEGELTLRFVEELTALRQTARPTPESTAGASRWSLYQSFPHTD
jgi:hypothetical protein